MADIETILSDIDSLSEQLEPGSLGRQGKSKRSNKKHAGRPLAEAHIAERTRKAKGKVYRYYNYCRGTDKEVYLGNADSILEAVKGRKK